MTVTESKSLKKGTRVYWRGDAAEGGVIAETSWDAVTITWDNGRVGRVHHGNMREIDREPRPIQGSKSILIVPPTDTITRFGRPDV